MNPESTKDTINGIAAIVEHCASDLRMLPTATDTYRARQTLELASLQLRQASARAPEATPRRRALRRE